jgi:carboxymethylenebutenolidase
MKRRHLFAAAASLSTGLSIGLIATNSKTTSAKTITNTPTGKIVALTPDLPGYYVTPIGVGPFPAVVVLMEAFGLNDYVKGVCDRLAKAGYAALAPDFYQGAAFKYTDMKGAIAKLKSMKDDVVMKQFGAGLTWLDKQKEVVMGGVGVVGFCMGGRYSFLANAVHAQKVKAAVAYYGGGIASSPEGKPDGLGRPDLLDQVSAIQSPIMFMYGTEDALIASDEHQRVALAMSKAKKSYAINVFSNAGHGFDSDRRDSYNAPAAWETTLRFFDRHLKSAKMS